MPASITAAPDPAGMSSAQATALDWCELVLRQGRLDAAWALMDDDGRLGVAQDWVLRNERLLVEHGVSDIRALAVELGKEQPDTAWADDFFHERAEYLKRTLPIAESAVLGAGESPRPLGPDLELVYVFDTTTLPVDNQGFPVTLTGETYPALPIVVRLVGDDWRVHTPGQVLLRPGWPPEVEEITWED